MKKRTFLTATLLFLTISLCTSLLIVNAQNGSWTTLASQTTNILTSVNMVSSNDVWIVGTYGTMLRWDGTTLNQVASPTSEFIYSIDMVSATDGWIVCSGGLIFRWNGGTWSQIASPTSVMIKDVFMVSANDGWAVGPYGMILRWNGSTWTQFASPTNTTLVDVFMLSANDGWAVGPEGTILRWNGSTWTQFASSISTYLNDVFMVSSTDGWIVGSGGLILRWNGSTWTQFASPTTTDLDSIFMVSANDGWIVGHSGVILRWNGSSWDSEASPTSSWLEHIFMVNANDGWAVGRGGTIIRLKGLQAPVASFTVSPSSPEVGETITLDATGSSDSDGEIVDYVWLLDDGNVVTGDTITRTYASTGDYTIELTVTDNDDLTDTTTKTITVGSSGTNPEASFTVSPSSPEEGETVTFDAKESNDPDGEIQNYSWDFGDENTTSVAATTVTHSYATADSYNVVLTVTDDDGYTGTATKKITIRTSGSPLDTEPPVAHAGSNQTVSAGSKVTFSGASSSDNVGIASYAWDFDDGNSGTGETVSHTYGAVGNYTVSLTVEDAAGNSDTVTIVITVQEAAPDGFPYWIILVIVLLVVAVVVVWYFLKKRKPKEKVPEPDRIKLTADPTEVVADGKSTSTITIELLDNEGKPVAAVADTEIMLVSSMGKLRKSVVTVPKGKSAEKSSLVAPKDAGTATVSADGKDLDRAVVAVVFLEKKRYCMHCGSKMAFVAKRCPACGKSPPAGVDTKSCKNCEAVIPAVAKFCAECGASQPKET